MSEDTERRGQLIGSILGIKLTADGLTGYEGEWEEGIKDDLGGMVIQFAETTRKGIDLGRKVEFSFGHVKWEMLVTSVGDDK